jgi:hypothetical protein
MSNTKTSIFETVSIPFNENISISVTDKSLPLKYIQDKKFYDHIIELVGAYGSLGYGGYRLFDETIVFLCNNRPVLRNLKSFTYLEFDYGFVQEDFNEKILETLNDQLTKDQSTKDPAKFIIKKIPANYGGEEDSHRNIVSFVRSDRDINFNKNINYKNLFKSSKNEIPFLNDKLLKELKNSDSEGGHPTTVKKMYEIFNQIKLNTHERVFDVGIGCLQLAIHAAYVTQTNVDGNDNSEVLLEKIQSKWGVKKN